MSDKVFSVYVIESLVNKTRYVGLSENPEKRLQEHNLGKSTFTKRYLPWKLIYTEKVGDMIQARKTEKYYKSAAGRRKINKLFPKNQ